MDRYNKYLVLKIADIEKYLSDEKQLKLDALVTCIRVGRLNDGKRDQEYVCVAADWPMHEQVWGMVEAFVDGKPNEIEQLAARVAELEAENELLKGRKNVELAANTDNAKSKQQREQVAAQAAVIEKLREALIAGWSLQCDFDDARRLADDALALSTDSTQILDEVRRAEREKCAKVCDENHWDDHRLFAEKIRAME